MWRSWSLTWLGMLAFIALPVIAISGQDGTPPTPTPLGFAPGSRAVELEAEAHALSVPNPDSARSWLRTLTEEPHVAGTPADHETAVFVRDKLREWGWQADLVEYEVLLNYPRSASLRLVQTDRSPRDLPIRETMLASDKDSASTDAFPAFHGYGVSGFVQAQVVYVNYGRPDDFAALEKLGVDVKDKVVLVRYGELFRGLKVRNAQKRGARGILIYSDPLDDGYARGDIYPEGPFRPESAIQRGSVQFLSLQPGDPSTPGGPSTKDAKRLPIDRRDGFTLSAKPTKRGGGLAAPEEPIEDVLSVEQWEKSTGLKRDDYYATIPSLPISYAAARSILETLAGPNVPRGWQGALPFAYHAGPGPAEVQLQTSMDYQVRTIWNVVATIPGTVEPERWVMVGNHRDAWVYGAVDPGSGTAATLEMCRALGSALRKGWKPRRTLVYASWDAEEYGLVGSTEWAEEHAKTIDEKAVLLLNVDSAVAGHEIDVDGVPSLRDWVLDAASAVTDVRSGKPLRKIWLDKQRDRWANQDPVDLPDLFADGASDDPAAARPSSRFAPQMKPLGSGSDYTVFLDHLGVPAIDVGFSGRYGVYHSIYDNFTWMEKVGDPEFVTHAMAARFYTVLAMRAAAAEVVPLRFAPYGEAIRDHVDDLRRLIARKARAARLGETSALLEFEGLPRLVRAVRAFQDRAAELDRATGALSDRDGVPREQLARVNDALKRVERAFLIPEGLPDRPWFLHAIYAPGVTTGYASWPLPGLRQALQDNHPEQFGAQLSALLARLDAATRALGEAAEAAR